MQRTCLGKSSWSQFSRGCSLCRRGFSLCASAVGENSWWVRDPWDLRHGCCGELVDLAMIGCEQQRFWMMNTTIVVNDGQLWFNLVNDQQPLSLIVVWMVSYVIYPMRNLGTHSLRSIRMKSMISSYRHTPFGFLVGWIAWVDYLISS